MGSRAIYAASATFAARVREAYADRDFFLLGKARGTGPNARGYPG